MTRIAIERLFRDARSAAGAVPEALDSLLAATGARASGLWRLETGRLRLVAFRSAPDMPREVHEAFAEATREVPLERLELGIVKAASGGQPASADLGERAGDLGGSAAWLHRFGAEQSLAVPIRSGETVTGVLAVSTPYGFSAEHPTWKLLVRLAAVLGGDSENVE